MSRKIVSSNGPSEIIAIPAAVVEKQSGQSAKREFMSSPRVCGDFERQVAPSYFLLPAPTTAMGGDG